MVASKVPGFWCKIRGDYEQTKFDLGKMNGSGCSARGFDSKDARLTVSGGLYTSQQADWQPLHPVETLGKTKIKVKNRI